MHWGGGGERRKGREPGNRIALHVTGHPMRKQQCGQHALFLGSESTAWFVSSTRLRCPDYCVCVCRMSTNGAPWAGEKCRTTRRRFGPTARRQTRQSNRHTRLLFLAEKKKRLVTAARKRTSGRHTDVLHGTFFFPKSLRSSCCCCCRSAFFLGKRALGLFPPVHFAAYPLRSVCKTPNLCACGNLFFFFLRPAPTERTTKRTTERKKKKVRQAFCVS